MANSDLPLHGNKSHDVSWLIKRQSLEHWPGFHNQNAAAPDCFASTGYTSMMSLSRGIGFHYQNAAAPDCLFVSIKSLLVLLILPNKKGEVNNGPSMYNSELSVHMFFISLMSEEQT